MYIIIFKLLSVVPKSKKILSGWYLSVPIQMMFCFTVQNNLKQNQKPCNDLDLYLYAYSLCHKTLRSLTFETVVDFCLHDFFVSAKLLR